MIVGGRAAFASWLASGKRRSAVTMRVPQSNNWEKRMFRIGASAFGLALLLIVTTLPGAGADSGKPGSVEDQFLELRKEYQTALKSVEGNDQKSHALAASFAPRFLALG